MVGKLERNFLLNKLWYILESLRTNSIIEKQRIESGDEIFLHNVHFSFIPSFSVVYKPGSNLRLSQSLSVEYVSIKIRQKYGSNLNVWQAAFPNQFQSKNIRESCTIISKSMCSLSHSSVFLSHPGL